MIATIYLKQTYGPIRLGPEEGSDAPGTRLLNTLKQDGLNIGSSSFSVEIPLLGTHVFALFTHESGDLDVYPILVDGDGRLSEREIMKELEEKFRGSLSISRYMLEQPSNTTGYSKGDAVNLRLRTEAQNQLLLSSKTATGPLKVPLPATPDESLIGEQREMKVELLPPPAPVECNEKVEGKDPILRNSNEEAFAGMVEPDYQDRDDTCNDDLQSDEKETQSSSKDEPSFPSLNLAPRVHSENDEQHLSEHLQPSLTCSDGESSGSSEVIFQKQGNFNEIPQAMGGAEQEYLHPPVQEVSKQGDCEKVQVYGHRIFKNPVSFLQGGTLIPANPSSSYSPVETNGSLSVAQAAANQATDGSIRVAPAAANQATADGSIRVATAKFPGRFKDAEYYAQYEPNSIMYSVSKEVEKDISKFDLNSLTYLGEGGRGRVYSSGNYVVKKPRAKGYNPGELNILLRVQHENIIKLLGVILINPGHSGDRSSMCCYQVYRRMTFDLNRALGEATLKDLSETENDDTWGTVFGNVKYIFTCIFRVLVFLKWHNIHHCDIKDKNILILKTCPCVDILHCICPLENKFKVKVADFDLAVDTGSRVPQSLRGIKCEAVKPVWIKGTPFTRAPEQCMNVVEKYDGTLLQLDGSWSDVWSAGTLMNRFCLGKDRRNNELIHSAKVLIGQPDVEQHLPEIECVHAILKLKQLSDAAANNERLKPFADIARECLTADCVKRSTPEEILQKIETMHSMQRERQVLWAQTSTT